MYQRAWIGNERPTLLFDLAAKRLVDKKVVLPGVTVLERLVSGTRERAEKRLWSTLAAAPTAERAARLQQLVVVPAGKRLSELDRLRSGTIKASEVLRVLAPGGKPTPTGKAVMELGRLDRSAYLSTYFTDELLRRRVNTQLNRQESRHELARKIYHGQKGELRQSYREGQEDQLGALGLMLNIVVLWNTVYFQKITGEMRAEGIHVRDEDIARLSPLKFAHINFHGRYSFALPAEIQGGQLRSTAKPEKTTTV